MAAKKEVLRRISFGKRIAEEEVDDLATYFVETDQWRQIFSGAKDVVFGDKGGGKSAIYSLLVGRADSLGSSSFPLRSLEARPVGCVKSVACK